MNSANKFLAQRLYFFLGSIFITALVVSNLIFQKFFSWYPFNFEVFGIKLFELSVGVLPYPITFLITDIISEIFGKSKANQVVIMGIVASIFSIGLLLLGDVLPANSTSPIDDETFNLVFSASPLAVLASMTAYLIAQFLDIRIYHFWKQLTKGKYLWLRNNFSTFSSQIIDSTTVIALLCFFDILVWDLFLGLVLSSIIFKIIVAIIDTPLLYLLVGLIRKKFHLGINDEIDID
ncbi:MAG: queuosine precursor transporter [Flavobacteriaceae bacterium]